MLPTHFQNSHRGCGFYNHIMSQRYKRKWRCKIVHLFWILVYSWKNCVIHTFISRFMLSYWNGLSWILIITIFWILFWNEHSKEKSSIIWGHCVMHMKRPQHVFIAMVKEIQHCIFWGCQMSISYIVANSYHITQSNTHLKSPYFTPRLFSSMPCHFSTKGNDHS